MAMPDAKNSSTYLLALVPGSQLLEQDEYTKPESQRLREIYRQYIVALLNGSGDTVDMAGNNATRILVMESRMAAAMMSPLQMREPANTYNMMTLAQAQALVPALDLRAFLKALGLSPPARVQVVDIQAMKALQRFLADQPAEDVKLLMRWTTLGVRAAELGGAYRAMEEESSRLRKGLKVPPEPERVVTQQIGAQPVSYTHLDVYKRQLLVTLRAKRQEGEEQLAAIKAATEDSWMQFKANSDRVWEAFKDSVHQFQSHFK